MAQDLVKTFDDLVQVFYKTGYGINISQVLRHPWMLNDIKKTSGTITTSVANVRNAVAGAMSWVQFNQEANAVSVLPKYGWMESRIRFNTTRANSLPTAGVAQDATLVTPGYPDLDTATLTPKTLDSAFEVTNVADELAKAGIDDDAWDVERLREYTANEHKEDWNNALLQNFDTLASNKFESIDRITASNSEQSGVSATVGDEDIYGLDRSAKSWADANSDHNSNTDRDLTDSLLQTLRQGNINAGANIDGSIYLTGHDTVAVWNQVFDPAVRYQVMGTTRMAPTVNGVKPIAGIDVGTNVSSYIGVPIIESKNVVQDTLSRIYLLDISDPEGSGWPRLGLRMLNPTMYFEAGARQGTVIEINKMNTEGHFVTQGELACRFFAVQGKLRDLK